MVGQSLGAASYFVSLVSLTFFSIPTAGVSSYNIGFYEVDFSDLGPWEPPPGIYFRVYNLIKVSKLITTRLQRKNEGGCFSPAFMIFKIITSTKKDILRLGETRTQSQTEMRLLRFSKSCPPHYIKSLLVKMN